MGDLKAQSRGEYPGSSPSPTHPKTDELKLGCLQRISEALEEMAEAHDRGGCCGQIVKERDEARKDRDEYRNLLKHERYWNRRHSASINALRGWITRYKKQIKELKEASCKKKTHKK